HLANALLAPGYFPRLARGDGDEQGPQAVAAVQVWEAAAFGGAQEAIHGAQGHVFFVVEAPSANRQVGPGQADEPRAVALPQLLRSGALPGLDLADPSGNRRAGRHGKPPRMTTAPKCILSVRLLKSACKPLEKIQPGARGWSVARGLSR